MLCLGRVSVFFNDWQTTPNISKWQILIFKKKNYLTLVFFSKQIFVDL